MWATEPEPKSTVTLPLASGRGQEIAHHSFLKKLVQLGRMSLQGNSLSPLPASTEAGYRGGEVLLLLLVRLPGALALQDPGPRMSP